MAGSGRGRGCASFTFNIEAICFGKGAALPDVIYKPPPPFPYGGYAVAVTWDYLIKRLPCDKLEKKDEEEETSEEEKDKRKDKEDEDDEAEEPEECDEEVHEEV